MSESFQVCLKEEGCKGYLGAERAESARKAKGFNVVLPSNGKRCLGGT